MAESSSSDTETSDAEITKAKKAILSHFFTLKQDEGTRPVRSVISGMLGRTDGVYSIQSLSAGVSQCNDIDILETIMELLDITTITNKEVDWESRCNHLVGEYNDMKVNYYGLTDELNQTRESLKNLTRYTRGVEQELDRVKKELTKSRDESRLTEGAYKTLQNEYHRLLADVSAQQSEFNRKLNREKEEFNREKKELTRRFDLQKQYFDREKERFKKEKDLFDQEREKTSKSMQMYQDAYGVVTKKNSELQSLKEENEHLEAKNRELTSKLQRIAEDALQTMMKELSPYHQYSVM